MQLSKRHLMRSSPASYYLSRSECSIGTPQNASAPDFLPPPESEHVVLLPLRPPWLTCALLEKLYTSGLLAVAVANDRKAAHPMCYGRGSGGATLVGARRFEALGGHPKSGHMWSLQNRPTGDTQNMTCFTLS